MRTLQPPNSTIADAVNRNISAIHNLRIDSDERRRIDQKFIDAVAAFLGSPNALYAHLIFYGAWIVIDLFTPIELRDFYGATSSNLSMVASLEAIFLAVFVLINQRRMNTIARKHSDLHLQMTLLTEHEITRIARVTDAVARHLGVKDANIDALAGVKLDINPNEIIERIADLEAKSPTAITSDHAGDRKL